MNVTERRTKVILDHLADKHYLDFCPHYGEPGYSDPEVGILFANWNPIPTRICDYLEAAGYELEWSDEWLIDYDNQKAYRTSANSYHWESSIAWMDNGEFLTPDDPIEAWIEWATVTDKSRVRPLPSRITSADLIMAGFEEFPEDDYPGFETGWFPGQTDDPKKVYEWVRKAHPDAEIVFRMKEVSQFYCKWACWYRNPEVPTWEQDN